MVLPLNKELVVGMVIGAALTVLAFTTFVALSNKSLGVAYDLDQHLLKTSDQCKSGFLCETHFSTGASMVCTPETTMQRLVEAIKGKKK